MTIPPADSPALRDPASFRDPSGFVYQVDGGLIRQVNPSYFGHYSVLKSSGLLETLWDKDLLVRHEETYSGADKVLLRPERIGFISFPYEWCFSAFRDAALLTLRIQQVALRHGMTLKDASAYNVQFRNGRAVFIDTLSFERIQEGRPWVAYGQFCRHFLAPLALMCYTDVRLSQLLRDFIDGLPLDLASRLLPRRSWLNFGLAIHLHFHARMQRKHQHTVLNHEKTKKLPPSAIRNLTEHLLSTVEGLHWKLPRTEWGDYYENTNYSAAGLESKKVIVREYVKAVAPHTVFDLGANDGTFSRVARDSGASVISLDIDPVAVEKNYIVVRQAGEKNILPLLLDLANPSPAIGWGNEERPSLFSRGPADCVLALALVHHLAISNNVPLGKIAETLARLGRHLIIEFVPKDDSKVQKLLASREDVLGDYSETHFETAFASYFKIMTRTGVSGSTRSIYLMKRL